MRTTVSKLSLCAALFSAALGCGGGASPEPSTPSHASHGEPAAVDDVPSAEKPTRNAQRHAARDSAAMSCEDGSCFRCGRDYCLSGFYCETNDKGEARGCGWMPSCATKTSCACLEATLHHETGCRCEEKDGGVFVVCG
jgi:hypothetical protein